MKKYEYFERFENWKNHDGATVVYNNEMEYWETWEDKDGILTGVVHIGMESHEEAAEKAEEVTLKRRPLPNWAKDKAHCKSKSGWCWMRQTSFEKDVKRSREREEWYKNHKPEPETLESLERRYFLLMMIDRPNWEEKEALREVSRKIKELGGTL